jgi:hypothetical protein
MNRSAFIIVLALLLAGCGPESAGDDARPLNTIPDEEYPQLSMGRDMLAKALRYDIERFVEKNDPRLETVFLDMMGQDPADDLMDRLGGTPLEVVKFSRWATYSKNERGEPVLPKRYLILSVRDIRIFDTGVMEVDTAWNASGIQIPGETLTLEFLGGEWHVTSTRLTPQAGTR